LARLILNHYKLISTYGQSINLKVLAAADGDGVIVVPRAHAKEVAEYAKAILDGDKAGRRNLYKKLGLPPDDSVK
jgi:4-hydroxy-4-methyl-2-oxoglutarate aldolase